MVSPERLRHERGDRETTAREGSLDVSSPSSAVVGSPSSVGISVYQWRIVVAVRPPHGGCPERTVLSRKVEDLPVYDETNGERKVPGNR